MKETNNTRKQVIKCNSFLYYSQISGHSCVYNRFEHSDGMWEYLFEQSDDVYTIGLKALISKALFVSRFE